MWPYIVSAAALMGIAVWALYYGMVYRTYTVYTKKLNKPVRIAQISDLHSVFHGKNQSRLMKKLDEAKPDVVMLTGDIFDRKNNDAGAVSFLQQVCKYPCFYVTGNHEYRAGNVDKKLELIKKCGITVLIDESANFNIDTDEIVVSGASDPRRKDFYDESYDYCAALETEFGGIDKSKFNILLAHNNGYISEYKKYPFDIVLSGHSHGGQFRIPFIMNGLYIKTQGFFPKNAGGMYTYGELVHIVSRGISLNPCWCPRIFNPTELVVIDIVPKA